MWTGLLALLTLITRLYLAKGTEFTVGYLTGSQRRPEDITYNRPGATISGAITLAVEEVNEKILAQKGHKLKFEVAETYGDETASIKQTATLVYKNVSGFIGPQETCIHEARIAAAFNLPMISYYCTHNETSNKNIFPTFARTKPPDIQISKSVAALLHNFNWTQVTFLYSSSPVDGFGKMGETAISVLESGGIRVTQHATWDKVYHYGYSQNPFVDLVKRTYQKTRIYVVLGQYYEHLGLLSAMNDMSLFEAGEYFVVGIVTQAYDTKDPGKYLRNAFNQTITPSLVQSYKNYLAVVQSPAQGFEAFSKKVNEYLEKPPFNFENPLTAESREKKDNENSTKPSFNFENLLAVKSKGKKISTEAAYLYDAVHLYAQALLKVLEAGDDPFNGTAIIHHVKKCYYKSALGYMVHIDENGDAEGNYTVLALKRRPDNETEYGLYPVAMFNRLVPNVKNLPEMQMISDIYWINGKPPVAEPVCGFQEERCISYTLEILFSVAGFFLVVFLVISFVLYRNWRYEQELDSLLWKVDYKDIEMNDPESNSTSSSKISRTLHPLVGTSQVSLSSNPDADFRYSAIYTTVGIYRGRVFAVKKIKKKNIDLTREMKKELKVMRDLRHDNLNGFIGACTDPPNICIVTEYCARGSLKDILENEEVKLDNMFISSLVADILRGILYLHESPVHCHGNLKPSNCLVDSRWVLKLTDFGFHEFKKESEDYPHHFSQHDTYQLINDNVSCKCEGLLYRAPELLRDSNSYITGTQKGDVYSFGIILYEINGRQGPFGSSTCLTLSEMLQKIVDPSDSTTPFRPPLDLLENSFDFVRDCLKECWAENPEDRPEFKIIRNKLRPMRKGMKPNIFDNMMAMMEKYANNLEVLVDERTDQLVEEKKKTDALLYEMLPRYVAEQLKRGHKVDPESFDSVTIYFSDIVGFTSMSAESTPLQVVDFLNDLYTCFDSIIENYDVYKVETIGDAYMVVSGLPIKNGDNHAGEIATMSLHLLDEVRKFRMRHRPYDNLMLRIGIHSGPVCAGVVGLKMPRYCLFGDTVNTASRMESTGAALKIHCSAECKALLDRLEGYTVVKRGIIGMKGKGEVLTYWLVGEEANHRAKRSEERMRRREQLSRKDVSKRNKSCKMDVQQTSIPRSSLKNKNSLSCPRNVVSRCVSLESPKKLRFANGNILECNPYHKCSHDPMIDVIFNDMPVKRRPSKVPELGDEFADTLMSVSCPCIENITSNADKPKIQSTKRNYDENEYEDGYCNSEPYLLTSSIPCISVNSVKEVSNSTKHISDVNIPLLHNHCDSVM
ncbi:guanylate cyclase 32E [Planococcus citri]|uniref:guanylate cyclase 32E n=1 Tax=Planococcus citri TaxID=170843 RepID=UPI0031F9B125